MLDLGVTRLLVQRLVAVFPKICHGCVQLAGSDAASRRTCNKRLKHLGRRSKPCKRPPEYVILWRGRVSDRRFSRHRHHYYDRSNWPVPVSHRLLLTAPVSFSPSTAANCFSLLLFKGQHTFFRLSSAIVDDSVVLHRYLVKHDEPQAVFTGKQQREGVSTMPYLVAGVWRASREPLVQEDVDPEVSPELGEGTPCAVGDGIDDAVPDLAARVAALCFGELGEDGGAECGADGEDAGDNSTFYWLAYRAVWKGTPMDEAITAMFAEFAVLPAEMPGYTCSTSPLPLTLDVGKCIADRAKRFVTLFLTPVLGPDQSSKVHRLLCHVMDAIRVHGNINNGNASINERMHKEDKPCYARTNRSIADFTRQLIVQAQGARAIQRHIVNDDEDLATVLEHLLGDGDGDSDGAGPVDDVDLIDGVDGGGRSCGTRWGRRLAFYLNGAWGSWACRLCLAGRGVSLEASTFVVDCSMASTSWGH